MGCMAEEGLVLMLRYAIEFKETLTQERVSFFTRLLREAADDKSFRDVVIANGGVIKDLRQKRPNAAFLRSARSKRP